MLDGDEMRREMEYVHGPNLNGVRRVIQQKDAFDVPSSPLSARISLL